jgi:hypothetical protein
MQFLRARFTVRGMMVGVAVVAVLLAIGVEVERKRRRLQFEASAAACGENARRMRINAMEFEKLASRKGSHPINKRMAEESRKWAACFERAREQWERAAKRSWPSLSSEDFTSNPDPPLIRQSEFPDVQFGKPFPP